MRSFISGFLGFVIPVIPLSMYPISGLILLKEQQNTVHSVENCKEVQLVFF